MSYSASFCGTLFLKGGNDADKVIKMLGEELELDYTDVSFDCGKIVIEFESDGQVHYDEDNVLILLGDLQEHIEGGCIEYQGEDDTFWKQEFENGEWRELQGKIVYDSPTVLKTQNNEDRLNAIADTIAEGILEQMEI